MPESFATVEAYARHVRQETSATLGSLCHRLGPEHPTTLRILALCNQAHEIVCTKEMREEVSDPARYDLAALPVPSAPSEDGE